MAWLGGLSGQSRPADLLAHDWSVGGDVVAHHLLDSLAGGAGQYVLVIHKHHQVVDQGELVEPSHCRAARL